MVISPARICSARYHEGGPLDGEAGALLMFSAINDMLDDGFVIAEIARSDGRYTLIIDPIWIELAASLVDSDQDLVEIDELPRSLLLAVAAGWPDEWEANVDPGTVVDVYRSVDGIPHLQLLPPQAMSG